MTTLRASLSLDAPVADALALGPALLDAARDGHARLAACVTRGPAVVLGARQRAGRVVASFDEVPVLRRATTGTAAYVGDVGLVVALALPAVSSLFADATGRTLLNRNVRPLLRALTRAGALAQYYGREWVAVQRRPAAVLGYELLADGRALLEAVLGWSHPVAVPAHLAAPEERALDRWRGHDPVRLADVVGPTWTPERLARAVAESFAERAEALAWEEAPRARPAEMVRGANDPAPEGMSLEAPRRVPIGWVDVAREGERWWFGGDALAATSWLDAAAQGDAGAPEALDGARPEDFARAHAAADPMRDDGTG